MYSEVRVVIPPVTVWVAVRVKLGGDAERMEGKE